MRSEPGRKSIPRPAARRLSLYLRELAMRLEQGESTVSSKALGRSLGLTDAQVRKDLAICGHLGHPGRGYTISDLVASLRTQPMGFLLAVLATAAAILGLLGAATGSRLGYWLCRSPGRAGWWTFGSIAFASWLLTTARLKGWI